MKLSHKLSAMSLAALFFATLCGSARAEDRYMSLAKEMSEAGSSLANKKIAIIPFSYADGREAKKDGSVISERITMKLIKLRKFEIVERSMLDKVMGELKLQNSGGMDAASTQQLGKLLGVEAIVTGTLVEMQAGRLEINARLIKTETAQAIGASQVTVEKDWIGDAATPQPRPQYQPQPQTQPTYHQPPPQSGYYKQPAPRQRGKYAFGFFDFLFGFGSPKMDLEFSNARANIVPTTELGINCPSCGNRAYRSVSFEELKTEGFGPMGLRVGGFGNSVIGGDFEMSYEKRNIASQSTTWSLNGGAPGSFTFTSNDYATVKSLGLSFALLLRVPGKVVNPYTGLGLGLSLNTIELPNVWGANRAAPAKEFAPGLMVRLPIGVRFRLRNNMSLFSELRIESNSMRFDRGFTGETDILKLKGSKFLLGLGFAF